MRTAGPEAISRPTRTFWTLPPESLRTGVLMLGVTTSSFSLISWARVRGGLASVKKPLPLSIAFQHHVPRHAHGADEAHAQPVLRHEGQGDAQVANGQGGLAHEILRLLVVAVVIDDLAVGDGMQARNGLAAAPAGRCRRCRQCREFPRSWRRSSRRPGLLRPGCRDRSAP